MKTVSDVTSNIPWSSTFSWLLLSIWVKYMTEDNTTLKNSDNISFSHKNQILQNLMLYPYSREIFNSLIHFATINYSYHVVFNFLSIDWHSEIFFGHLSSLSTVIKCPNRLRPLSFLIFHRFLWLALLLHSQFPCLSIISSLFISLTWESTNIFSCIMNTTA